MKLLVISHACVTPQNQSFYSDVERDSGWNVSLIIPSSWRSEYRADMDVSRWKGFEGPIHSIPVWKPGSVPLHVYKNSLARLIRKERPDAMYVHHEPYGLATLQAYLANWLVGWCPVGFYAAQNLLKIYPIPIRWAEASVFKSSSFCFPVTQGALSVLRSKGYRGKADVLPLAIDRSVYHPKKDWAKGQRAHLGISGDTFVIGYVGRLVEEKGIVTLLFSLASLAQRDWICIIAGSGPDLPRLRTLIDKLNLRDRILLPGYVPHEEAAGWLTLFDLLMLPSETRPHWKEQFGRVITEANACGTPVIGSDSGEIPYVIKDTGGGMIFPEGDSTAMAAAIQLLMDDPVMRHELAVRGQEAVGMRYDQAQLASKFVSAIKEATGL